MQGSGRYADAIAHLDLRTGNLNLAGLHAKLNATGLSGTMDGALTPSSQHLRGTLQDKRLAADFDVEHAADRIDVRALAIRIGAGRIEASGALALAGEQAFKASGRVINFNPAALGRFESASLNAQFDASGHAGGVPAGSGRFIIRNSRVRGFPIEGAATLDVGDGRIRAVDVDLSIAGNSVQAKGVLGTPADTLQWRVDAQYLGRLGLGIAGGLAASGVAQGTLAAIESTFTGDGKALVLPGGVRIGTLTTEGRWSLAATEIRAFAQGVSIGDTTLDTVDLTATGTFDNHALRVCAFGQRVSGEASAAGGLLNMSTWRGTVTDAVLDRPIKLRLRRPVALAVSAERIALQQAELQGGGGTIHIDTLAIEGERVASKGRFSNVRAGDFAPAFPGLRTDLALAGTWDITSRDTLSGSVSIHREQGDVTVTMGASSMLLGLSAARLDLVAQQNAVTATLSVQGAKLGDVSGRMASRVTRKGIGWTLPDIAPLDGELTLDARTLAWLGAITGGDVEIDGRIAASVRINGTVGNPRTVGTLQGEQLRLAFPAYDIRLTKGTIAGTFDAGRFNLVKSIFHGDAGSVRASGFVGLTEPLAGDITLDFDQLQAINDPSRTLKLSGQLRAKFTTGLIALTGSLGATEGRIRLADASVPRLGNDVVVNRTVTPKGATRKGSSGGRTIKLTADLDMDLGNRFAFEGRGAKAVLSGRMRVQTAPTGALRITGIVRVEEGTVMVYGKVLDIERGTITFTGPIDNPQLNLTATRRGIPHRVGVQVTGLALEPRAMLFSEPSMPNSERLSWLVMGRSSEGMSATDLTLLGTAASAVIGNYDQVPLQSRVAGVFGLDELAVRTTGEVESSVVAIGKRISDKLYVSVERNLLGLGTALALRYQFNKNWSLQGQTGLNNTIDLLYTVNFEYISPGRAGGFSL